MARTSHNFSFDMCYEIKFKTAIRGHHVYQAVWIQRQEEWLVCKKDNCQEALEHDPNAIGVYKECSEDSSLALVGHVLTKFSRLEAGFLGASKMNSVSVQVCGKRKCKAGLNVPGLYRARMKKSKFGSILAKEI